MPKTQLVLGNGAVVDCEVLNKFKNTYQVQYYDPKTDTTHILWVGDGSVIFPQFSELVF